MVLHEIHYTFLHGPRPLRRRQINLSQLISMNSIVTTRVPDVSPNFSFSFARADFSFVPHKFDLLLRAHTLSINVVVFIFSFFSFNVVRLFISSHNSCNCFTNLHRLHESTHCKQSTILLIFSVIT